MEIRQINKLTPTIPKTKKVAAYARVSCGKEAMLHSLSAQISYYSDLIGKNPDWDYRGVFVDEAISGTKEARAGFQKMLEECRAGNIELILTKSISRLARNTVTILESVRELKALGVDIFFEEQKINSLSAEGELMLTILASYAQEESRSASENVKWRIRKDFKEGRICGMTMLGYHLVNGVLTIIPEEAEIVQQIFDDYLSGMGLIAIMKKYRNQDVVISRAGLAGMLRNEKYQGDMLLQKSFVSDHITKRKVRNIGQLPQYYVTDSHAAIIDKETFAAVQAEIARRSVNHKPKPPKETHYPFTGMIICGKCGTPYRRKHAVAGTKYEKIVWICNTFNELGKDECDSQQIPENILMAKSAEVLGLGEFDETTFKTCVHEILVPEAGKLIFIFNNGRKETVQWENPSRRKSWTPEMREAARQHALKRYQGKGDDDE